MQSALRGLDLAESGMARRMARILLTIGVIILAILAWAWIGGGQEPLHEITHPVALPESAK